MTKRQETKNKMPKMLSPMKKITKKIAKLLIKKMQKHRNKHLKKRQVERSSKERKTQTQSLWQSYKKEKSSKSKRKMGKSKQRLKMLKEDKYQINTSNNARGLLLQKDVTKWTKTEVPRKVPKHKYSNNKQDGLTSITNIKNKRRRLPNQRNRSSLGI